MARQRLNCPPTPTMAPVETPPSRPLPLYALIALPARAQGKPCEPAVAKPLSESIQRLDFVATRSNQV